MKKENKTRIGHQFLSVLLGVMTTLVIKEALALNEDLTLTIITMVSIVFWYLYIDLLLWIASKIPDEKKKETKEV